MARKSPVELYHLALDLHRAGWAPDHIADHLGLHPGSVATWVTNRRDTSSRGAHPPTLRSAGESDAPGRRAGY